MFYNKLAFRLVAPPLFGVVIYLLILMFFDSVNMLAENFFSRELMFIFGLTYLFFEANRAIILLLDKILPLSNAIRLRVFIQYLSSFVTTIMLVSLGLYLYFRFIEGFTTIQTELITFNLIYLFAAVFYHLFHISMVFLYKRNDRLVEIEMQQKAKIQLEMETFRNQVNPEFLFQSLESVISTMHVNKKQADDMIASLAKAYRYTLDTRHNETITLKTELESLEPFLKIYEARYPGAVIFNKEVGEANELKSVVPCTLSVILEKAVLSNILSEGLPLKFSGMTNDNSMLVSHNINQRLREYISPDTRMESLQKAYEYFSKNGIITKQTDDSINYRIPLLSIEEE